jgi:hypothetical protein
MVAPTVLMRWPRDWRCIVRVCAVTRLRRRTFYRSRPKCGRARQGSIFILAIELKSERSPLGGVGLGSLKGCVVGFAWGGSPTFPRSMPLPYNRRSTGLNGDTHFRDVNGKECTEVLAREHTKRIQGLAVQASKPKIRLASEIAYQPSMYESSRPFASRVRMLRLLRPRRNACVCFAVKPITLSSRSTPVLDWRGQRR